MSPPTDCPGSLAHVPVPFCTRCFASSRDSSWGDPATEGHCFNCGSGGTVILIPEWAVINIRANASWVGRRYYPSTEDKEIMEELRHLRSVAPDDRDRVVNQHGPRNYYASQPSKDGEMGVYYTADTLKEALDKAKILLPYRHRKVKQ